VLRVFNDSDWVVCEVADVGGGTAPAVRDTGFLGRVPPDPHAPKGHGLWVVRQLCDLVTEDFGAGGAVLRLHFRR
ncbi:hypothetical protein RMO59_35965, partial [Streptomyces alfalfae]